MKELVYATQHEPWMEGKTWNNARFFTTIDPDATQVYVAGDYPRIISAYRSQLVPVVVVGPGGLKRAPVPLSPPPKGLGRRRRRLRVRKNGGSDAAEH